MLPLSGFRILDLTNVLAGPFCCHQLAHLGAEVVKVEAPATGDLARQLGADVRLSDQRMGVSFLAQNAGKKSITLNLKHPDGKALFEQLVESADALVENFRPGVMDRLGLGWEKLNTINSRLVYCAISGYGQTGPMSDQPAYDQIVQGVSGLMSITGAQESAPLRTGFPVCDTIGGLTAAMAVCSALAGPKDVRKGRYLDVSMLEATLAAMGWVVSDYLIGGREPAPNGNENATAAPSGTFLTADGLLNIAANKQEQWQALARHLGCEHLLVHPDFAEREVRKKNRVALKSELEKYLAGKSASEWAAELAAIGVPAGPVLPVAEILASEHIRSRDLIAHYSNVPGIDRPIDVLRPGVKIDGAAPSVSAPPPRLGEHQSEVLAELGLSDDDIEALRKRGAI